VNPPHRAGNYKQRARRLVAAANRNPATICWRCGRTLNQHPPHRNGKPARWTAGHTRDEDPTAPLAPEASTCNYTAGAVYRNRKHGRPPANPTSTDW
jgi:hypothetical protein